MDDLRVGARVGHRGRLAREQPRRRGVRGRVGDRERHALEVVDPLPELDPLGGPLDRDREQPLHRPGAARTDVDPLGHEPLVREVVGLADPAEPRRVGDADVLQHELRVPVGEGVHVVRVVLHPDARGVVVDEEQGRQARFALHDHRLDDHEIGVVRPGHEPLLAVDHPVAAIADGRRRQRPGVRAGARLRDGVGAEPLTSQRRLQVSLALLRIGVGEHLVGAGDERPQPAGDLAVLLVDEHLLEDRPALAADLDRQLAARQPGLDRGPPQLPGPLRREPAAGLLELDLDRLEHLDDEPPGAVAQRLLGGRQRQVHRPLRISAGRRHPGRWPGRRHRCRRPSWRGSQRRARGP